MAKKMSFDEFIRNSSDWYSVVPEAISAPESKCHLDENKVMSGMQSHIEEIRRGINNVRN